MKYNGPKEKLMAASSVKTKPEELAELAGADYGFVRAAVAQNPNTPLIVLEKLLPTKLEENFECETVLGLLRNPYLSSDLFLKIEKLIESAAQNISPRDYYQNVVIKILASCNTAPLEAILPLADVAVFPKHIRSRIANSNTRPELLESLSSDPSEKISQMATKALNQKK